VTFSTWLKEARIEAGLTQDQLSQRSGVSQTRISALEGGKRPGWASLLRLCGALGRDPQEAAALVVAGMVRDEAEETSDAA